MAAGDTWRMAAGARSTAIAAVAAAVGWGLGLPDVHDVHGNGADTAEHGEGEGVRVGVGVITRAREHPNIKATGSAWPRAR